MSKKTSKALPPKHQAWVQARRRHRLSHAHVPMARELGMNPKKLGSIDDHDQEPWKEPLLFGREAGGRQVRSPSTHAVSPVTEPCDRGSCPKTGE